MSQEPPRKLDYGAPRQRRWYGDRLEDPYAILKFFLGFASGVTVSAIMWTLASRDGGEPFRGAILLLPLFIAVVAGCFMIYRPLKLVGAGLLASMAVGCLIFLSLCGPLL